MINEFGERIGNKNLGTKIRNFKQKLSNRSGGTLRDLLNRKVDGKV